MPDMQYEAYDRDNVSVSQSQMGFYRHSPIESKIYTATAEIRRVTKVYMNSEGSFHQMFPTTAATTPTCCNDSLSYIMLYYDPLVVKSRKQTEKLEQKH